MALKTRVAEFHKFLQSVSLNTWNFKNHQAGALGKLEGERTWVPTLKETAKQTALLKHSKEAKVWKNMGDRGKSDSFTNNLRACAEGQGWSRDFKNKGADRHIFLPLWVTPVTPSLIYGHLWEPGWWKHFPTNLTAPLSHLLMLLRIHSLQSNSTCLSMGGGGGGCRSPARADWCDLAGTTPHSHILNCPLRYTLGWSPSKAVSQDWQHASSSNKSQHHSKVTAALEGEEGNYTHQSDCGPSSGLGIDIWSEYRLHSPTKASQGTTLWKHPTVQCYSIWQMPGLTQDQGSPRLANYHHMDQTLPTTSKEQMTRMKKNTTLSQL